MSPETCITLRIHNADKTSTSIPIPLFSVFFFLSSHLLPPLLMLPFMLSSLWQSLGMAIDKFPASHLLMCCGLVTWTLCPVVQVPIAEYFFLLLTAILICILLLSSMVSLFLLCFSSFSHCSTTAWTLFNLIMTAAMCHQGLWGMCFLHGLLIPY